MNDPIQIHMTNRNTQIGNICSQFSFLELLLAQAIWSALELTEETGLIVTGRLDIEARANMAAKLCQKLGKPEPVVEELKRICRELQSSRIIERRNSAIHGHRHTDPSDPAAEIVVVHRGKHAGARIKRSDSELGQLGKDIADLHKPLFAAMTAAGMTY